MGILQRRNRALNATASAVVLFSALLVSSSYAADLIEVEPAPVIIPAETWSGFYGGVHAGAGAFTGMATDWDDSLFDDPDGDIDLNGFAGLAGIQAGYNWQVGNAVYGIEADWAWTGFDEDRYFYSTDLYVKSQMDWLATLRGRLGLAQGNALAYVTGGLAWAGVGHCGNYIFSGDGPCTDTSIEDAAWDGVLPGLAAGAGVELALSGNWSLKGEYLFTQFDKENVIYDSGNGDDVDFSDRAHLFRLGLNWHPNGLPQAEEPAGGPWSGLYGGVHAGAGAFTGMAMDWDYVLFEDPDGDTDLEGFAGLAGIQAGYNWQTGNAIYGVEADWAWTGFGEARTFESGDSYIKAEIDWLATLRGRLGLAVGNALGYVTGGLAWADVTHCANYDDPCSIDDDNDTAWSGTLPGLVAGAGVETKFTDRWSLKGEYLYAQFDRENVNYDSGSDYDLDFSDRAHIFRIGLNYKFGG